MLGDERAIFLVHTFVTFLLFSVATSQIPLGSRLSVEEHNHWVSSNGDFAIGFFNTSNQYSIGIRFNSSSIPTDKQTVVWIVGCDILVGNKSYLELTQQGELVLFDSASQGIVWKSETKNQSISSALLRENGNLVLLNEHEDVMWQSFDTPCDTLLPSQNFSAHQTLRPTSRSPISSYYTLYMEDSGLLKLRWESNVVYWTSPITSRSPVHAALSSEGLFELLDHKSESVWSVFGEDHNDSDIKFRFLRLDSDGNLRMYSWQNSSRSWRSVWQAFDNQCDVFATCGLRGICTLDSAASSHVCSCPFGEYESNSNSKCLVPYQPSCPSGSSMVDYKRTLLYGIYPPNETVVVMSLRKCRSSCEEDPSCVAVSFINENIPQCRIMRTQYISGKTDASWSSVSFVKTCSDPMAVFPAPRSSQESSTRESSREICVPCLIGVSSSMFFMFLAIQFGIGLFIFKRRKTRQKPRFGDSHGIDEGCVMLLYSEIKDITENFKHQIGPNTYRGRLHDKRLVAVKKVNSTAESRKFRTIVSRIGSIHHKNLVKLDGYCFESGHRFLVYEFLERGSLRKCLEDVKTCNRLLTWRKRIEICLVISRAISYLHTECREFVSHGNLKCENVMLDDDFEPKLTEFGLTSVLVEGPDVESRAEKDVMDFGYLMLVLLSGCQDAEDLCGWAYEKWTRGQAEEICDGRMEGAVDRAELDRVLRIALWCMQFDERMRPSIGEVVQVLEGTLDVDPPPPPFACPWPDEEPSRLDSERDEIEEMDVYSS